MAKPKSKPVLLGSSGGSLVEMFATETPAPHPLVGLFCRKTSVDPERLKNGWNWDYQARVHSVVDDTVMLQYYSALDGAPTTIKPIPMGEMMSGAWVFYASYDQWFDAGTEAIARFYGDPIQPAIEMARAFRDLSSKA